MLQCGRDIFARHRIAARGVYLEKNRFYVWIAVRIFDLLANILGRGLVNTTARRGKTLVRIIDKTAIEL